VADEDFKNAISLLMATCMAKHRKPTPDIVQMTIEESGDDKLVKYFDELRQARGRTD